jgi:hypothetical protein
MSNSLTWQKLPEWLLEPVMQGHLLLWEAAWLWGHCLMQTEEFSPLPPQLFPAAEKLALLEMEALPGLH